MICIFLPFALILKENRARAVCIISVCVCVMHCHILSTAEVSYIVCQMPVVIIWVWGFSKWSLVRSTHQRGCDSLIITVVIIYVHIVCCLLRNFFRVSYYLRYTCKFKGKYIYCIYKLERVIWFVCYLLFYCPEIFA